MIILITGGSSGLGEAITRKLAGDSRSIVFFTFNRSESNALKIEAEHPNTHGIRCNFKVREDLDLLIKKMDDLKPDVLVNNAYSGAFMKSYFHKTGTSEFLESFEHNIIPTLSITQTAINIFRKKKSGKILTVLTSALINVPPLGTAAYVANKAYLSQMSKVWATENAKYNITSNTVSPSFMLTAFTAETDERVVEQLSENHPLKTILTTQEVAETIAYLVRANNHLNGIDIPINAAQSIR